MGPTQGSRTNGAALGAARGEHVGASSAPLWDQKTGSAASGYCNLTRMVWVHSCTRWLPMDFLASEARRDQDLHGRVVPMDSDDFRAHSMGFFQRADQWIGRHSKSPRRATSSSPLTDADMSKHVFPVESDERDLSMATPPADVPELARGPSRPFLDTSAPNDQPPRWKTGDVALFGERSAIRGQCFTPVVVVERATGESTSSPADADSVPVTDGASTFTVDARDLGELEIPAALVPRLLSHAGASPSQTVPPHPQSGNDDPWGWLSPAGLAAAEEVTFPVAAHAVRHLVGKSGTTARLIEDICGIILGVCDAGDGTASVTLFGPDKHLEAARVIVEAMETGAWSLPRRLKERGFRIG